MIFDPLVDWSGFWLTPPAAPRVDPPVLSCTRTCPACSDADGEVRWYGDRTCFVCDKPIGVPS